MSRISAPLRDPDINSPAWQRFFARLASSSGEFTPVWTNLALGAGGDVVYEGRYRTAGSITHWAVKITPSGGKTTASTANSTYFVPPQEVAIANTCAGVNATTGASLGIGTVSQVSQRIYTPTWAATTGVILLSGWYETTA